MFSCVLEKTNEITDRTVMVPGMTERETVVDLVAVAASVAGLGQITRCLEVLDDMRRRSFGDADARCDIPEPRAGIGIDALEHVGVVRDEPPEVVISRT